MGKDNIRLTRDARTVPFIVFECVDRTVVPALSTFPESAASLPLPPPVSLGDANAFGTLGNLMPPVASSSIESYTSTCRIECSQSTFTSYISSFEATSLRFDMFVEEASGKRYL